MPENAPLLFDMMGHTGLKTYIILNVHSFFIPYKSIIFMDTSRKKETDTMQNWTIKPTE